MRTYMYLTVWFDIYYNDVASTTIARDLSMAPITTFSRHSTYLLLHFGIHEAVA